MGIRKTVCSYVVDTKSALEIIWVACKTSPTNVVLIGNCYRPPDSNSCFIAELRESITDAINLCHTKTVFLFGDFNLPQIDWNLLFSPCNTSSQFISLTLDFNLVQVVNKPTRGNNILDLILTSAPDTVVEVLYREGLSDHRLLEVTLDLPVTFSGKTTKKIRDYNKANYAEINNELEIFFNQVFLTSFSNRSVHDNWVLFRDKMTVLINKYIPLISISNDKCNAWFAKSLNQLRNKKKRLYRNAKRLRTASAWDKYKQCLNTYCAAIRSAKLKYFSTDLGSLLKTNPKKFWREISRNRDANHITLHDENHEPLSNSQCCSAFNTFFASMFTREDQSTLPNVPDYDYQYMKPIEITAKGIECLITKLKLSSSAGADNINSKVLKNTIFITSNILCYIFQQSLESGQIPDDWKVAKVTPLFKSGDQHLPQNYRPISLTSICCKLLEHIIASHIYNHLESNQFFFRNQHGFRKGWSCETQLLEFTTDLHSNMNNNLQIDCIFLDFSKAFDRVPHCRLISKLSALQLDSLTLSWLRNFLSLRKQFTVINNDSSSICDVTSGVPQGSVLAPLLFLIFINDLPDGVTSFIRIFADDCIIYHPIKNVNDHYALQKNLDVIMKWCETWQMVLNASKCKTISFSRKHDPSIFSYRINNDPLSHVSTYKYLGLHFTQNLSWSSHITNICANASRSLGYLRRNLHSSPANVRKLAYETFVRPQLEFASPIWSPHQNYLTNMIEAVQNRAVRFISRNYNFCCSVTQLKMDYSLQLLSTRRNISLLCLFHKYVNSTKMTRLPIERPSYLSTRLHNRLSFSRMYGKTNSFNASALPRAITLWNDLPDNLVSDTNPVSFRNKLVLHFG